MAGTWMSPEAKAIKEFAQRLLLDRTGLKTLPYLIPVEWDLPHVGGGGREAKGDCSLLGADDKSYMLLVYAQKERRLWKIYRFEILNSEGRIIMSQLTLSGYMQQVSRNASRLYSRLSGSDKKGMWKPIVELQAIAEKIAILAGDFNFQEVPEVKTLLSKVNAPVEIREVVGESPYIEDRVVDAFASMGTILVLSDLRNLLDVLLAERAKRVVLDYSSIARRLDASDFDAVYEAHEWILKYGTEAEFHGISTQDVVSRLRAVLKNGGNTRNTGLIQTAFVFLGGAPLVNPREFLLWVKNGWHYQSAIESEFFSSRRRLSNKRREVVHPGLFFVLENADTVPACWAGNRISQLSGSTSIISRLGERIVGSVYNARRLPNPSGIMWGMPDHLVKLSVSGNKYQISGVYTAEEERDFRISQFLGN